MNHQIIVSSLFFALSCYVGLRVFQYLPLSRMWKWFFFLVYLICAESFLIHRLAYKAGVLEQVPQWLSLGLSVAQACCIILALLSLAREAVLLAWFTVGRPLFHPVLRNPEEARKLWLGRMHKLSVALCIAAMLITAKGVYNALQVPQVVEVEIYSPNIPPALDGFKIAQLSDLHIGSGFDAPWLLEVVERTNGLEPDVIALTGDMLDGWAMQMKGELAPINDFKAKHAVYVIDGNHEYYVSYGSWLEYMNKISKHKLLRNQGEVLQIGDARLGIAGATDIQGRLNWQAPDLKKAYKAVGSADYKVLLWHRPKDAQLAADAGFDMMLSGHTHGGQFFPGNLLVAIPNRYAIGLYDVDGMDLYVNPGSSLWGRVPLRLVVQSEITLLVLRSGEMPG